MQAAIPFPDISSEVFSIELFGAHLALRWYALAYLAGLFGGLLVIRRLLRRPSPRCPCPRPVRGLGAFCLRCGNELEA